MTASHMPHESRARPLDADALPADAGAFEQQRQSVGEQFGLRDPGFADTASRDGCGVRS